jgi:septal ring factor EnvC (AmiA/AmiB activator)
MMRVLLCFLLVIFAFSAFCRVAKCDDRPAQDQSQIFTNEDIKKYQTPSESRTVNETDSETPVPQEDVKASRNNKGQRNKDKKQKTEEREIDYWCEKATACKRKIEDEKAAIKEIEDEIFKAKTKSSYSHKKNEELGKKLDKAKKRLKKAEGELTDLENTAHRKGAKPGWLRCQR